MSDNNLPSGATRSPKSTPESRPATGFRATELQQVVEVATSYLETGQVDDADDILQEVLEAGETSPEINELIRLIDQAREAAGRSGSIIPSTRVGHAADRQPPIVHFTAPLPGAERLPRTIQRTIAETERDFNAGRWNSALDLATVVIARAPDFIPNYLRTVQIRLALGEIEGAEALLASVEALHDLDGSVDDAMIRGIRVAMDSGNSRALIDHARDLLKQQLFSSSDPFLPAAIKAALDSDPDTARELAQALLERRPNDEVALCSYVRALVASSATDEIHQVLEDRVRPETTSIGLLWCRAALAMQAESSSALEWLARVAVHVRADPGASRTVQAAIRQSESFVPAHLRHIGRAAMSTAAEHWDEARDDLEDWTATAPEPITVLERYVASGVRAEIAGNAMPKQRAKALGDLFAASTSAAKSGLVIDVPLFSIPATPDEIFTMYVEALSDPHALKDGLNTIRELVNAYPEDLVLRQKLATLLVATGQLGDGIRELRAIASEHEAAGDIQSMADAMQSISDAVPENIEVKQTLIEMYLKRGILDAALRELEAVGSIEEADGDIGSAIAAFTRAAEIACAMGNFRLGNELYDRGVDADPNNVPVRHAAVAFYLQTGAVDRAADHLREIVRIALDESDPDEAVAALHQIIGLAPLDFDSYHKLGEVLTTMGEYKQAERVYRRLADITPGDPVLQAKQSALAVLAATG